MSGQVPAPRHRGVPTSEQLSGVAAKLRALTPFDRRRTFEAILSRRTADAIADALDELAALRASTPAGREKRLQDRVDELAVLATSRRLPLAAVEGAVRRAEDVGAGHVPIEVIKRALQATEPRADR